MKVCSPCTLISTSHFIRVTDKNLYHIGVGWSDSLRKRSKKLIYLETIIDWQSEKVIKNYMVNPWNDVWLIVRTQFTHCSAYTTYSVAAVADFTSSIDNIDSWFCAFFSHFFRIIYHLEN